MINMYGHREKNLEEATIMLHAAKELSDEDLTKCKPSPIFTPKRKKFKRGKK